MNRHSEFPAYNWLSKASVILGSWDIFDATIIPSGRGGTPYIRMIGTIVVFLGVVIGGLVFLRVVQAKSLKKIKLVFVRVWKQIFWIRFFNKLWLIGIF